MTTLLRDRLQIGQRLISLTLGETTYQRGGSVVSVTLDQLPGPEAYYFVAVVRFEMGPDRIIPLHQATSFEVSA